MNLKHKPSERGQALVLIAFAIIGLIGLTALAVDGGNAYSDRRNAQNAADTAALAAGLAYVRPPQTSGAEYHDSTHWGEIVDAALARADSNGYDNNGTTNTVEVVTPPTIGNYAGTADFMQVIITSNVDTYFAPIVGIDHLTNQVYAVVYVDPTSNSPVLPGNAIVSCNQHACPAVEIGGGSATTLISGGMFVNSDCADDPGKYSFKVNGGGSLTAPSLCTVGPYENENLTVGTIDDSCKPVDCETDFIEPNISCSGSVSVDPDDPTRLLPGTFSDDSKSFPPSGIDKLAPGAYCITSSKGFRMTSGTLFGEEVVIAVEQGGIIINTDGVELHAPTSAPYDGLLFFVPKDDGSAVTINGNSTNEFTGAIMAIGSHVTINGGSTTEGFKNTQIISDTADITGGSNSNITYDGGAVYEPGKPPRIELIE